MTTSHPGGPDADPPDIVASGSWRGHTDPPADLTPPGAGKGQVTTLRAGGPERAERSIGRSLRSQAQDKIAVQIGGMRAVAMHP
jgi:hypothetical protein